MGVYLGIPALKKDGRPQIGRYVNRSDGNLSISLPGGETVSWSAARCMIVTRNPGRTNLESIKTKQECGICLKTDIAQCFFRALMKYMYAVRTENFDILD